MRFALLLACATLSAQTPTPGRGVNFYSIEKEQALGAQIAAEYRHQARIPDAPSVNTRLDDLGQRLAPQAPATGFTYTFELVDDDQTHLLRHVGGSRSFPTGCSFENGLVTRFLSARSEEHT